MKQIAIITMVPTVIHSLIENSILRQAHDNGSVVFQIIDLREYGKGNYHQVDDAPFGGGSGMVMMAEPLSTAIDDAFLQIGGSKDETRVLFPAAQGTVWNHDLALENSNIETLIIICGRYKGIDQRVIDKYATHEYSLGDYIVSNGELSGMVIIDSIVRLIPGALNSLDSAMSDSFAKGLLDHPHYTRPRKVDGMSVPDVLLSGNHESIDSWRRKQSEKSTREKRPDIWKKYQQSLVELENDNE